MSKDEATDEQTSPSIEYISIRDFLETIPPNQVRYINDLASIIGRLNCPELELSCSSEICSGKRVFRVSEAPSENLNPSQNVFVFAKYICSNCRRFEKRFALVIAADKRNSQIGQVMKLGEFPPYGPGIPSKLKKLVASDRDNFMKGLKCESQGFGVGAFSYYRKVIENQKNRLLQEIISVLEKSGSHEDKIEVLEQAIKEIQFKKALGMAKDVIPESLMIESRNPIALLHQVLSEGIHDLSDEECLDRATSVRILLTELSERLTRLLEDNKELKHAVQSLTDRKRK